MEVLIKTYKGFEIMVCESDEPFFILQGDERIKSYLKNAGEDEKYIDDMLRKDVKNKEIRFILMNEWNYGIDTGKVIGIKDRSEIWVTLAGKKVRQSNNKIVILDTEENRKAIHKIIELGQKIDDLKAEINTIKSSEITKTDVYVLLGVNND